MLSRRASGGPTVADLRRLRAARRAARAEVAAKEDLRESERRDAFRRELAATVRRASPFLLALLEAERMTLESVLMQVGPIRDWPEGPSLYRAVTQWRTGERAVEQAVASLAFDGPQVLMESLPEGQFRLADGGWMRVCVVGHSVEVESKVGATDYQSQFGELTVRARSYLPEALAAACVGRLLDEVALHPLTAGRGWRVKAAHVFALGTTVTVETGSVPFRFLAEVIP